MFLKNFTVFQLNEAAVSLIVDRLFLDVDKTYDHFIDAVPGEIEKEFEMTHTSGFTVPEQTQVESATCLDIAREGRFYLLTHVQKEKVIDAAGIRDRVIAELGDELGPIALDETIELRCKVAREVAPIKEVNTRLYVTATGLVVVGAVGGNSDYPVRDLIAKFCRVVSEDDPEKTVARGNYDRMSNEFMQRPFSQMCMNQLKLDVWGGEELVETKFTFNGDFKVKLLDKAVITAKNVFELPSEWKHTLAAAEFVSIAVKTRTEAIEYEMTLTPKGEVKSFGVGETYQDEFDVCNPYLCLKEMMTVFNRYRKVFGAPVEEE